jgi:hypothetical protein
MTIEQQAQAQIITLKNGKLAALTFTEDKAVASRIIEILTEDYIKHGGVITRYENRKSTV